MTKFIFTVSETFHSKFQVEAIDPENAIEAFFDGEGQFIEKSAEHYGTNEAEGYKGILEMLNSETYETFEPELIEELAFKKTYQGERLYTLEEARALIEGEKSEKEEAVDITVPAPAPAPAIKSE